MSESPVSAVVLAAGVSSRMGRNNKLLLDWGGRPVLVAVLDVFHAAGVEDIIVVLGHEAERIRRLLPAHIRSIINRGYAQGMATSLRCGVAQVSAASRGAFIALGDMPLIQAHFIRKMRQKFDQRPGGRIIVPYFRGRQGNPVLFARSFFAELQGLEGDRGARMLLKSFAPYIVPVEAEDDSILTDIDSLRTYQTLRRRLHA